MALLGLTNQEWLFYKQQISTDALPFVFNLYSYQKTDFSPVYKLLYLTVNYIWRCHKQNNLSFRTLYFISSSVIRKSSVAVVWVFSESKHMAVLPGLHVEFTRQSYSMLHHHT